MNSLKDYFNEMFGQECYCSCEAEEEDNYLKIKWENKCLFTKLIKDKSKKVKRLKKSVKKGMEIKDKTYHRKITKEWNGKRKKNFFDGKIRKVI